MTLYLGLWRGEGGGSIGRPLHTWSIVENMAVSSHSGLRRGTGSPGCVLQPRPVLHCGVSHLRGGVHLWGVCEKKRGAGQEAHSGESLWPHHWTGTPGREIINTPFLSLLKHIDQWDTLMGPSKAPSSFSCCLLTLPPRLHGWEFSQWGVTYDRVPWTLGVNWSLHSKERPRRGKMDLDIRTQPQS